MFASDRASSKNSPIPLTVGSPAQRQGPGSQDSAVQLLAIKTQPITLRRCDDEPALEYGCVDWFLYDKQRPQ